MSVTVLAVEARCYSSQEPPAPRRSGAESPRRSPVRIALFNLFYPPDLAPSGHLVASVAEHRAGMGDDVTVICGTGSYVGDLDTSRRGSGRREAGTSRSPRIRRVWTPSLGKGSHLRRLADYAVYFAGALARAIVLPRHDVVIACTTPPFIVAAAVVHRALHPRTRVVLWSLDLYPDAAEAFGTIRRGGVLSRLLRAAQRALLRRVDHVVAVDRSMLERVVAGYAKGGSPSASVIPTWEPFDLYPQDRRTAAWPAYASAGLDGRFVVLHLGNLGLGYRTDTIVEVAERLADIDAVMLFVGGGARYPELDAEARRRGLTNVTFHGYVPKEDTPSVLAGAACMFISMDDRSLGIMSPCKMNGALAMGIPVVYAGPPGSTVDDAIRRYGCGFSLRHRDVEGIVAAIRSLHDDAELRARMAEAARRAFDEAHSDHATLPVFDTVIEDHPVGAGRQAIR